MLFLCFSVKDRDSLINDFNQYIANFGIETWYDRKNIYIGDKRHWQNIEQGAENTQVDSAVIFYSDNFANGNICLEEFESLKRRYEKGEIQIFPVFLGKAPQKIDEKFKLCTDLVYKEIYTKDDYFALAMHIVSKMVFDRLKNAKYSNLRDLLRVIDKNSLEYSLLSRYEAIDKGNYAMRIAYLYSAYKALTYTKETDYMFSKTMDFLFFKYAHDNIIDEKRELLVMENIALFAALTA